MSFTANTRKTKASAGSGGKSLAPYYGPRRFDPAFHGGLKKLGPWFLFFGVILPLVAMIYESSSHFCAQHYFDPFPSTGHVLLFALIPLSNLLAWWSTRRDLSSHYAAMSLLSGMAMGVAILYALMLLPITAAACMATAVFGFGLLALAPLLSLPCNWISAKSVCHLAARKITYFNAHQVDHIGHMIILVMVIAVELPSTLTRINLSRAAEADSKVAAEAVAWLRQYGSLEVLQRACYEHSGRATDILGSVYESGHPLSVYSARRLFYRVTGKPFNTVPIPLAARATIQRANMITDKGSLNYGITDEFDLDTDIAGEAVSGMARGLSLSQSELHGQIDADAALASLDWSLTFANCSKVDREARLKILLPPQAVVTKASLIINGRTFDATILVREAARAQYQSSVISRKDPLLVSMCGVDQLLVQCYPVRPDEAVKVRLEIAAPLALREDGKAVLLPPAILERNFLADQPSDIDLTASDQVSCARLNQVSANHLVGPLSFDQLGSFAAPIIVSRHEALGEKNNTVWCRADRCFANSEVERVLRAPHYADVHKLLILIDGSASMQPSMPEIAQGLKALPSSVEASVQLVGDRVVDLYSGFKPGGSADYLAAIEDLKKVKPAGGQDDYAALCQDLRRCSSGGDTAVLWLHAAQPLSSGSGDDIKQCMPLEEVRPCLFDMQLVAGPNELLNGVYTPDCVARVPRSGTVSADLIAFMASCRDLVGRNLTGREWDSRPTPAVADIKGPETAEMSIKDSEAHEGLAVDDRLLKIWANRQIAVDLQNQDANLRPDANKIALLLQIVSPVSSAVVVQTEPGKDLLDIPALASKASAEKNLEQKLVMNKAKAVLGVEAPTRSAELFSDASDASGSISGDKKNEIQTAPGSQASMLMYSRAVSGAAAPAVNSIWQRLMQVVQLLFALCLLGWLALWLRRLFNSRKT